MAGSLVFIPSVLSSHGKILRRGVTWSYIQSSPLPFLQAFFPLSESVMSHEMKTNPEFPGKVTAVPLYLVPYLLTVLFVWEPGTWWCLFTVFPAVAGCNHKVGRTEVDGCGHPTGGHAWGSPDWSFKEQRPFQEDIATPGCRVYTRALSHLSLDGDRTGYCPSQSVFYFSLWFVFIFKKKSVKTQWIVHV